MNFSEYQQHVRRLEFPPFASQNDELIIRTLRLGQAVGQIQGAIADHLDGSRTLCRDPLRVPLGSVCFEAANLAYCLRITIPDCIDLLAIPLERLSDVAMQLGIQIGEIQESVKTLRMITRPPFINCQAALGNLVAAIAMLSAEIGIPFEDLLDDDLDRRSGGHQEPENQPADNEAIAEIDGAIAQLQDLKPRIASGDLATLSPDTQASVVRGMLLNLGGYTGD